MKKTSALINAPAPKAMARATHRRGTVPTRPMAAPATRADAAKRPQRPASSIGLVVAEGIRALGTLREAEQIVFARPLG